MPSVYVRQDLTVLVVNGQTTIEAHLTPDDAMEMADALETFATMALAAETLDKPGPMSPDEFVRAMTRGVN